MVRSAERYGEDVERALSLWVILTRSTNALTRRIHEDIRARGFSGTEWGVLEYLYHKGPQPMCNIGEKILVTSGSVTYVIDKLESRGLLKRRPCEEDRRVTFAELTEEGRALMASEFPEHARFIKATMEVLSPEEQEVASSLLKKLGLSVSPAPSGSRSEG